MGPPHAVFDPCDPDVEVHVHGALDLVLAEAHSVLDLRLPSAAFGSAARGVGFSEVSIVMGYPYIVKGKSPCNMYDDRGYPH